MDPEKRKAALAVFQLRPQLEWFFIHRGQGQWAAELADETIFRVILDIGRNKPIEDLAPFTFGVARNVLLEHLRHEQRYVRMDETDMEKHPGPQSAPEDSRARGCFETCIQELSAGEWSLIRGYYAYGKNKDNRARLAQELGISSNALMIRAHRIRKRLAACLKRRLEPEAEQP